VAAVIAPVIGVAAAVAAAGIVTENPIEMT